MRSLRLVALSDDGGHLVVVADEPDSTGDGERFELPLDDRLRALLRAEAAPAPAPADDLPPRVIQARIRGGETPEQVAASSGTRVERIMRFAHPVLQERERVAEQAREARVRLTDSTPGSTLQQFMTERLRLIDTDIDAVTWDAYRSDTAWVVSGAWRAGEKSGTARWTYDLPSRTVSPLDALTTDFAEGTRLVRVVPGVPAERPIMPVHRSAAVPERTPAPAAEEPPAPVAPPAAERRTDAVPLTDDEIAEHDTVVLRTGETDGEDEDPRARIPAWEDIVFGVRRNR